MHVNKQLCLGWTFYHRHCAPCEAEGHGLGQALQGELTKGRRESLSHVPFKIVAVSGLMVALFDVNVTAHPL
jgi:hypothetical protein